MQRIDIDAVLDQMKLPHTADDATLHTALVTHGWHEQDIEAFLRLRAGVDTTLTHRQSLHKLMGADHRLHPETVTSMLQVSFTVDALTETNSPKSDFVRFFIQNLSLVVVFGCVGAILVFLACMWWFQLGWFHPLA